jgi:hypothetical protein
MKAKQNLSFLIYRCVECGGGQNIFFSPKTLLTRAKNLKIVAEIISTTSKITGRSKIFFERLFFCTNNRLIG